MTCTLFLNLYRLLTSKGGHQIYMHHESGKNIYGSQGSPKRKALASLYMYHITDSSRSTYCDYNHLPLLSLT